MLCGAMLREQSRQRQSAEYRRRQQQISTVLRRSMLHNRWRSQHRSQSGLPLSHAFIGHYVSLKRWTARVPADLRICAAQR